jgi:hypothetical protein
MPVVHEDQMPVIYVDWAEWRAERLLELGNDFAEQTTMSFCFTCAGNGRVYENATNGEGLFPRSCVSCLGRGMV